MKAQTSRLFEDVKFLNDIRPYRNYLQLQSLAKVSDYIKQVFIQAGLEVREQKWIAMGKEYTNVIGIYNSDQKQTLIVGAHYDVCGDQPGADDNASAVAGLLETARLLFTHKPVLNYRIELVAYCLEEPPFFGTEEMGSFIHAKSLHQNKVDVIGMICFEMIGYFSDEPHSQPFPTADLAALYPHTANFIIVVGITHFSAFTHKVTSYMSANALIDVQEITFDDINGLAGLSDQRSYWHFGYPALMINDTSFIRNPHYHQITDTIDTLDFCKMTAVVDCAYNAVINME